MSENRFNERLLPWEGIGSNVSVSSTPDQAIDKSGLSWTVAKRKLLDSVTGKEIPNFVATVREDTDTVLGIVNDARYQIVQNIDAYKFTKSIVGGDVMYDTAGSIFGGKKVWLSAKIPWSDILGDRYDVYLLFINSHDGNGAVRVVVTPVRVVCKNTLNLALDSANRSWSCNHRGKLQEQLHEASKTLALTEKYMVRFSKTMERLNEIDFDENKVVRYTKLLLPINEKEDGDKKMEHIKEMRDDILFRWKNAPDLSETPKTGYRFMNAVSDFAVHTSLHRDTPTFRENLFGKVIAGNGLYIDKAFEIINDAGGM